MAALAVIAEVLPGTAWSLLEGRRSPADWSPPDAARFELRLEEFRAARAITAERVEAAQSRRARRRAYMRGYQARRRSNLRVLARRPRIVMAQQQLELGLIPNLAVWRPTYARQEGHCVFCGLRTEEPACCLLCLAQIEGRSVPRC